MARPIEPDARRHAVATRVNDKTRQWLELWRPGGTAADQIGDVLDRAQQFWPCGPEQFGHGRKAGEPAKPRTTPAISRWATAHGISKAEATNMAWEAFIAQEEERGK